MTDDGREMTVAALATRTLTFGGATIEIEYTSGRSREIVDFLFKRIPNAQAAAARDTGLCLLEDPTDGVFTLTSRGEVCCVDRSAGVVASWLLHLACSQLAGACVNGLLLHAAAVQCGGRSLLLPGATGSGKSTLAAFLTNQGFVYLTDESAYVAPASPCVEGFCAPLKIKNSGLDALAGYVPLSTEGPGSIAGRFDILVDPDRTQGAPAPVPLSVIVFPRHEPGSRFRLKALSPSQTGFRLMASVMNAGALPDHGFRDAARVAGLAMGYDMRFANLGQIEAHLERLRLMTSDSPAVGELDARVRRRTVLRSGA